MYQEEEKQVVANRDCDYCDQTSQIDMTIWKATEFWTCPKCKSENERKLY